VRDSLADDAVLFGPVATELVIPAASADPWRTEPPPWKSDKVIEPQEFGGEGGYGKADVGLLIGSTLEVLEVKEATWGYYGAKFAEDQLSNYLIKAEDSPDLVTANWRARGHPGDEIKSVKAMPMERLNLQPNPRVIEGEPVSLRWCSDGIVVFKVKREEEKPEEQKPKEKETGPRETLPEKLLKMGGELAVVLAAAGLLSAAMELAGALAAVVTSPLLALAALVLGIIYFWDELKWLGRKIVGLVQWVGGKIAWIGEKIKWLGIKVGELVGWLGGKIKWLAERFAAGAKWAAGMIGKGAKWVGGKIASAAESVWDWLFGSDPELTVPNVDLPVTETTEHCGMAAYEDAMVKIGADLLFAFNESQLKPEADSPLKEAAVGIRPMLGHSDDRVWIKGYTDNVGTDEYNQDLSERRAQAVSDWFVEHRVIPRSIIKIEGWGKTKAQYNDPEGRAKDRRVEIWVLKHGSVGKVCL
jgi:outer membrane protein OmpA-like peptidoglycan-associated protein